MRGERDDSEAGAWDEGGEKDTGEDGGNGAKVLVVARAMPSRAVVPFQMGFEVLKRNGT